MDKSMLSDSFDDLLRHGNLSQKTKEAIDMAGGIDNIVKKSTRQFERIKKGLSKSELYDFEDNNPIFIVKMSGKILKTYM